jgi:hypothetical protein
LGLSPGSEAEARLSSLWAARPQASYITFFKSHFVYKIE